MPPLMLANIPESRSGAGVGLRPPSDVENGVRSEGELRRRQRREWERVASSVHDFHEAPTTQYYRRCEIALIERCLGPLAGRRLLKLDLWNEAHNTRILHWMAEQGAEVHALDLSSTTAARARRNANGKGLDRRMLVADIREIPFADQSFDLLYTMGTIEHIDEYRDSMREIHRVLKPGGRRAPQVESLPAAADGDDPHAPRPLSLRTGKIV